ncbi:MAG: hydrogenase [Deltaproteobacteria bacterium]|nr:hydrogenase [Deltaproteobacteria bacterium]
MPHLATVVLLPLALALVALATPSNRLRPLLVPAAGVGHATLTGLLLWGAPQAAEGAWLGLDPLGRLVLGQVSLLFLISALYAPGYLALRPDRDNRPCVSMCLVFVAMMSLAILSRHIGLMWIGVEASTLSTASLIYFNRNARSIEATWKYLLIGSVGVSLALLGSFFLAYAGLSAGLETTLFYQDLLDLAPQLSRPWLRVALVLLFLGYGTKMGLAPMHAWKPDAYGEAPGVVGALLAGGLTSTAFLAVLRFAQLGLAAHEEALVRPLFLASGLLSMGVAAVFMVGQADFKRLLAYSSVEHMGLLVIGVGLGGGGTFAALYHMLTNAFTKGALFLSAANLHRAYGSKQVSDVRGALVRAPASGAIFLLGFFAITGAPPFGPFMSELALLSAALSGGRVLLTGAVLLLLFVVFLGMGRAVLSMALGPAPEATARDVQADSFATVAPAALLLLLSLALGLWLPAPVLDALRDATAQVEGRP